MAKQPRENRIPIMMSEDELKPIDDWRFRNRIGTRSDAIRRLVQIGLLFDEHGDGIAEAFYGLYNSFNTKVLAAAEALSKDDDNETRGANYISQTLDLSIETIENLSSLHEQLNLVMVPALAMKAPETFKAAQYGFLAAKADSMARLLQQKIDMYEIRKQHGLSED